MMKATSKFSARVKQATALCRAVMIGIDKDGRRSQVFSNAYPSVVFVWLSIPKESKRHVHGNAKIEGLPKSESPSFVLSEWMDAWLSASKTCSELPSLSKGRNQDAQTPYCSASLLMCIKRSLLKVRSSHICLPRKAYKVKVSIPRTCNPPIPSSSRSPTAR